MSTNKYDALIARLPNKVAMGKLKVISNTAVAASSLRDARLEAEKRVDLNALGKALYVQTRVKEAIAPALARSRRQYAYHERLLQNERTRVHEKAVGKPIATDAEWRTYLRSLPADERADKILKNSNARGAALREPGLSGADDQVLSRALEVAVETNAREESAALAIKEQSHEIHDLVVRSLADDLSETPMVVETNGDVRKFRSHHELESFVSANVPLPEKHSLLHEEVEADLT